MVLSECNTDKIERRDNHKLTGLEWHKYRLFQIDSVGGGKTPKNLRINMMCVWSLLSKPYTEVWFENNVSGPIDCTK
jgi:hypothetical protein